MYRINLHPEYEERRRRTRQGLLQTVLFSVLLGCQLLLVGSLILSAVLLDEQVGILTSAVPRLERSVADTIDAGRDRHLARQLFQVRDQRIEWSPILVAMAEVIPDSLEVVSIEGVSATPKDPASLLIRGHGDEPRARLDQVTRFIEGLRQDPRVVDRFSDIRLGTIKGDEAGQFQVICSPGGGGT